MTLVAEGSLDVEVLLGKSKDARSGFQGIELLVDIDADMSQEEKRSFLKEVDRRCPLSDNIANTTPVTVKLKE